MTLTAFFLLAPRQRPPSALSAPIAGSRSKNDLFRGQPLVGFFKQFFVTHARTPAEDASRPAMKDQRGDSNETKRWRSARLGSMLEMFFTGEADFHKTKESLQRLFPAETHAYATVPELLTFISRVGTHQMSVLEKYIASHGKKGAPTGHYDHYLDPERRMAVEDLFQYLKRVVETVSPLDVSSHWKKKSNMIGSGLLERKNMIINALEAEAAQKGCR